MNADEIADKVARAMLSREGTGPAWGIAIEEAREGYARSLGGPVLNSGD